MPRRVESGAAPAGALRSLVGAGPSQVGVVGALRARDVSRPSEDDVQRSLAAVGDEPNRRPLGTRQSRGQGATGPGNPGSMPLSS